MADLQDVKVGELLAVHEGNYYRGYRWDFAEVVGFTKTGNIRVSRRGNVEVADKNTGRVRGQNYGYQRVKPEMHESNARADAINSIKDSIYKLDERRRDLKPLHYLSVEHVKQVDKLLKDALAEVEKLCAQ